MLGSPLASATLVQEYLIGLLFLRVAGWIFLLCGALIVLAGILGAITMVLDPRQNPGPHPFLVGAMTTGIGLGIGAAGAWFGILRGRVITEMCWFCPRGMIWMTEGVFDWYTWEEVRELYCHPYAVRPAIGIRFDDNLSMISFRHDSTSCLVVRYIEKRASAACAAMFIRQIAEQRTVRFGEWRLSGWVLRSLDVEISWRDVTHIQVGDHELQISCRGGKDIAIVLDDVPFPSLFTALVQGIWGHVRESSM